MSKGPKTYPAGSYITVRQRGEEDWAVIVGNNGEVIDRPMSSSSRTAAFQAATRMAASFMLECLVERRAAHG